MEIVPAGLSVPFDYTAFDLNASLSIAMKVYDVTGVPTLVTTSPMLHVVNGSYQGQFTPVSGKIYLINKMVYTDGTFATPDINYSPGSETFYAQADVSGVPGTLDTVAIEVAAIKVRTDLIPSIPATEGSVLNIPLNTLLASDGRLVNLDAPISSRVVPSDLSPYALEATLNNTKAALALDIAAVQVSADEAARPSDITTAVAPLATAAALAGVQTSVNALGGATITPADIWSYSTRGLTAAVDTTDDLTPLAKISDVTAARDAVIASLTQWTPKLVTAINPTTDNMTLMSWLELNGQVSFLAETSSVSIYDSTGTLVMSVGPDLMAFANGVFSFTRATASAVLTANTAYTCTVDITIGSTHYLGTVPITVF